MGRLIDEADIIDSVKFVRLEPVLRWKMCVGREKDLRDVELIEGHLRSG